LVLGIYNFILIPFNNITKALRWKMSKSDVIEKIPALKSFIDAALRFINSELEVKQ